MSEADPIEDVISDDDSEMVTVWAPEPSNDADDLAFFEHRSVD